MKLLTVFPLLAIFITGTLLLIPSEINADLPDSYYKDHAYSVKTRHWIIDWDISFTIELSKEILSGMSFENSVAKKKIENALDLRSKALFYNQEFRNEQQQIKLMLENKQYKNSYNRLLDIDKQFYNAKKNLDGVILEIKEARDLQIQDNQICFLFWCYEIKSEYIYSELNPQIQVFESKLDGIENKLTSLETYKNTIAKFFYQTEVSLKDQELQNLENLRKQQQYEADVNESQLQEQIRQEQLEAKRQVQFQKQQQEAYEAKIKAQKQSTLQILASTNPLLKKIMTGKITFWVENVPYYAAPGVANSVERMLDAFESWNGVSRVYNEGSADIRIQWIKEFSPHQGGQYWQSYVQVGLGQTACKGKWQPFTAHSVRQVLWHEIGHAMGHGHSNDQNNVMMGNGLEKYFYKEYEDDLFLDDGSYSWRSFCRGGQYTFSLKGSSESSGFKFWVITPETDARKFIGENKGLHYPDCTKKGVWVSYTMTCNAAKGSYLLVYNPRDNGKTINVDVVTQYTGEKRTYNMLWDPATLRELSQYQYYLDSLR